MIAVWFVKNEVQLPDKPEKESIVKHRGVVITSGPTELPDVTKSIPKGATLLAIRQISLLLEFDADHVDFVLDQTDK